MKGLIETTSPKALESGNSGSRRRHQLVWIGFGTILCALFIIVSLTSTAEFSLQRLRQFFSHPVQSTQQALIASTGDQPSSWTGWQNVEHLFTFGDSYSRTRFDPNGPQPCESNPIGNPAYPGVTTIGSPVWTNYLTTQYNESMVRLYNFAEAGATIDNYIAPSSVTNKSFAHQVDNMFAPVYGGQSNGWNATNSLFVVFFGINDVLAFFEKSNGSVYPEALAASYLESAGKLYASSARNILFISTPPIDRAPHGRSSKTAAIPVNDAEVEQSLNTEPESKTPKAQAIGALNAALGAAVDKFNVQHADATVWWLDAQKIFNDVLDDPESSVVTSSITNTNEYCKPYARSDQVDLYLPQCGGSRDEYFWSDVLHPTSVVHMHLAQKVAETLEEK